MNKKAITSLIASVLLIMIVVSIGAAVMVVIQKKINDQPFEMQCFNENIFSQEMLDEMAIEIKQDMNIMMPQYNWSIDVNNNCIEIYRSDINE